MKTRTLRTASALHEAALVPAEAVPGLEKVAERYAVAITPAVAELIDPADAVVRIDLATHYVTEIVGAISDRDVKRAERLVARHAKKLKQEWAKIHGND